MALHICSSRVRFAVGLFCIALTGVLGSLALSSSPSVRRITNVKVVHFETARAVYNLNVSGNENYYVGAKSVLVHNCTTVKVPASTEILPAGPAGEGVPAVVLGNHRAAAVIANVKSGQLPLDTVVGSIDGFPLTAGELTELYDAGRLATTNGVVEGGAAYFNANKAARIRDNLDLVELWDPRGLNQTASRGILVQTQPRARPYSALADETTKWYLDFRTGRRVSERPSGTRGIDYMVQPQRVTVDDVIHRRKK